MAMALALLMVRTARAGELAGVVMPDTRTVGGTRLVLNGMGVRTFSILGVHIYVAGLYLRHPDHDGQSILASPAPKLLQIDFVHDVSADRIREAWKEGLTANCPPPCKLPASELRRFLGAVRSVKAGESFTFVFDNYGVNVYEDGKLLGQIANEQFGRLMLAVFIGRHTAQHKLKQQLLGNT